MAVECNNCGDPTDEWHTLSYITETYCPECWEQRRWEEWYSILFEQWGWA